MQTFLPYPDFDMSAKALDDKRLSKQILETLQILNALAGGKGYANHPVTLSWQGYEDALRLYGHAVLREYRARGGVAYADYETRFGTPSPDASLPPWIGQECFHKGHRGHLFRKNNNAYALWAHFAHSPLLYPYKFAFVERVAPGRFMPYPCRNLRVYPSVKDAWEYRTRDHFAPE